MGLHIDPHSDVGREIQRAIDEGRATVNGVHAALLEGMAPVKAVKSRKKPALVEPAFCPAPLAWTIPLVTASEVNGREWRKRSKRSDAAWSAVSKAMGPTLRHLTRVATTYHAGLIPVRLRFVRLGGQKLDRSNLPTALKAVEDAVAFMIGADDGDSRWQASWDQEPGGPCGVRIEVLS